MAEKYVCGERKNDTGKVSARASEATSSAIGGDVVEESRSVGALSTSHAAVIMLKLYAGTQAGPTATKPSRQTKPHAVPLHACTEFAGGGPQATHAPAQRRKPELQTSPHDTPSHVGVEFVPPGQAVHAPPQLLIELLDRHWLPQRWKPESHTKSQLDPLQLGVAFAGVVQAAHALPQNRKLELQAMPQFVPSQVATPFAEVVHAEHEAPQLLTELSARHWLPQRWYPVLHAKSHEAPEQLCVAFVGVAGHEAQVPPHSRAPLLHERPQETPSQVATPLADVGHALHEAPQLEVEVFNRHWLPHRW